MDKREFLKASGALVAGSMLRRVAGGQAAERSGPRENWAGNLTYSTDKLFTPATLEEVQQVVKSNAKLRALGTRHSFNRTCKSRSSPSGRAWRRIAGLTGSFPNWISKWPRSILLRITRGPCGLRTACMAAETDYLRHHPSQLQGMDFYDFAEGGSTRFPDFPFELIPSGWFYQNELRGSKFILEHFLPIGDVRPQTISPTVVKEADEALRTMRRTPYSMLGKMFLPGLMNSPRRFAWAQAAVNLARTACALERHRLAQGKYPPTLDALAPQFIPKVPHDPIGGQPLHYRPTDDGQFILYSVGWNEKDDGGIVSLTKSGSVDLDNGDWVWRYRGLPKP